MVFSSTIFTFGFLPVVLFLYFIAKENCRNYILLIASLIFYAYGEPKFVFVMLMSIVANYIAARAIGALTNNHYRKLVLILAIIVNIGILFVFKYLDFTISVVNRLFGLDLAIYNIMLPIGISFFTFQAMSYVIDVYQNKAKVQKNICYLALYISFFPQLVAGPIVRYNTIEEQIYHRTVSLEKIGAGAKRFMLGFAKKIILSNQLAIVSERVFISSNYSTEPILLLWLGSVCFSLQIFYDFSGYSDMAIGLGKMFGFEFEENFRYPYMSKSITEFWRRWHISLGNWFRDYVYIPLGGSRVTPARHIVNLFVVWLLTGIWHGANYTFIAWGLFYFILLVIEKMFVKPEKRTGIIQVLWRIVTLLCINFGWILFNASTLRGGGQYICSMLGMFGGKPVITAELIAFLREYGIYMLAGIVFATPIAEKLSNAADKRRVLATAKTYLLPVVYLVVFLWATSFLILGAHNPFIYFNF